MLLCSSFTRPLHGVRAYVCFTCLVYWYEAGISAIVNPVMKKKKSLEQLFFEERIMKDQIAMC